MPDRKQLERGLQGVMHALDQHLEDIHGERMGATLFVFELGKAGGTNVAYVSNAQRQDMISAIKEWLARQEVGVTSDPLGPKGSA